jgi:hypothetical protein
MGDTAMREAIRARSVELDGPRALTRRFPDWLGNHPVLGSIGPAITASATPNR